MVKVSIIIPSYNRKEKITRLIESIYASNFNLEELEVIVVDNGSKDGTQEYIKQNYPKIVFLQQRQNTYCAGARNIGAKYASGAYLFFVDDDNVLDPECVTFLSSHMESTPNVAVCGPIMMFFDEPNKVWCAGGRVNKIGTPYHMYEGKYTNTLRLPVIIGDVDYFPNAFMVRRIIFEKFNHDTSLFPHNWCEQDLCARIKKQGYLINTVTGAITRHDFGVVRKITRIGVDKTFDQAKSRLLYRRKHLNKFLPWLAFWLIIFPLSTLYYVKTFFIEERSNFVALCKAYFVGTYTGIKQSI